MAFSLYDDQYRDVVCLRNLFRQVRCSLYVLPTGGGKTVCAGYIAQGARRKQAKILILVHRRELVKQFFNTLKTVDLHREVGIVCPGYTPTPWAPIQLAMVFSWARRKPIFQPNLIIIDEAHHVKAQSWSTVIDMYPEAKVLGLTATPVRLDKKSLKPPFEAMHCGNSIASLISQKRLSPVRVLRVPIGFMVKGVKGSYGDYNRKQLDAKADAKVVANAANAYCKYIKGRRTIMFGVTKRHARATAEALRDRGVRAAYVGDDTETMLREEIFSQFSFGKIDVVCNVSLIDEGFDVPECDAIMDVRPTQSITRALQAWGRALRYIEDKVAIILDLVGNTYRHGLPNINRTWTLDDDVPLGAPERAADMGSNLRCCKNCLTLYQRTQEKCPHCGTIPIGKEVHEVDVELEEVLDSMPAVKKAAKAKKEPKMTATERSVILRECRKLMYEGDPGMAWENIYKAGINAGYHPNWAHMMADLIGIPDESRKNVR